MVARLGKPAVPVVVSGEHPPLELPHRLLVNHKRRHDMAIDKDRTEGSAKNLGGKAKEALGKLTGDTKTQAEGKADQAEGKVQNTIGGIKDAIKGK